jgi:hypothetical protein
MLASAETTRNPALIGALIGAVMMLAVPAAAFDDPPPGSVSCGQKISIRSSALCNGGPATIIGGCNLGPNQNPNGPRRQTICTASAKKKK